MKTDYDESNLLPNFLVTDTDRSVKRWLRAGPIYNSKKINKAIKESVDDGENIHWTTRRDLLSMIGRQLCTSKGTVYHTHLDYLTEMSANPHPKIAKEAREWVENYNEKKQVYDARRRHPLKRSLSTIPLFYSSNPKDKKKHHLSIERLARFLFTSISLRKEQKDSG